MTGASSRIDQPSTLPPTGTFGSLVTIDGSVEGDLHGSESVVVNATGRVSGNIFAPRVGLVDGALFSGRIDMSSRPTAAAKPPAIPEQPGVALSAEQTERLLGSKQQ